MIGICFKYNPGYKELLRTQYYQLVRAYPDLTVYEREVSVKEPDTYNNIPFVRVSTSDDLPIEPKLVVISPQNSPNIPGDISLVDYVHPENVIYFLGDDQGHLTQKVIGSRIDYDKVYIPMEDCIYSDQAIAIVLYDRQIKNG